MQGFISPHQFSTVIHFISLQKNFESGIEYVSKGAPLQLYLNYCTSVPTFLVSSARV